jgi:hypothetical protein
LVAYYASGDVNVPKARAFGMTLEVLEDGAKVVMRYWRVAKAFCPSFSKVIIDLHEKWVFGQWGFCKGVSNVDDESDIIEGCYKHPGQAMGRLFVTDCVSLNWSN